MFTHLEKRKFIIGEFDFVVDFLFKQFAKTTKSKIILPCSLNDLAIQSSEENKSFYKKIDYCTNDSMMLTHYFRHKYKKNKIDRVYGPELMLAILDKSKKDKSELKHYFIAPNQETMEALKKLFKNNYQTLNANFSFLKNSIIEKEEIAYLKKIPLKKIDVLWMGVGSPKQIKLANWLKDNSSGINIFCVGAAFDFISGRKKQAPKWIRKSGLEWLFRLISEPKRLWRRYIITIPKYLIWQIWKKS